MPAPSALAIKTSAVVRLIKEEAQYHKELVADEQRLQKMEASGNEDEYAIKQQKTVVEQTKSVVPALHIKLLTTIESLEQQLETTQEIESADSKKKAEKAIADGRAVLTKFNPIETKEL